MNSEIDKNNNELVNNKKIIENNEVFIYTTYLDIPVLQHESSGFINATKICNDNGKQIKNILRNQSFIRYRDIHSKDLSNQKWKEHCKAGYLYFIKLENCVKIGKTYNIKQRYPEEVRSNLIHNYHVIDYSDNEQKLIKIFNEKYEILKGNEYFIFKNNEEYNEMENDYLNFIKNIKYENKDILDINNVIKVFSKGYSIKTNGTYMHTRLIYYICDWCIDSFILKSFNIMDMINKELYIKNITLEQKINELENEIKSLNENFQIRNNTQIVFKPIDIQKFDNAYCLYFDWNNLKFKNENIITFEHKNAKYIYRMFKFLVASNNLLFWKISPIDCEGKLGVYIINNILKLKTFINDIIHDTINIDDYIEDVNININKQKCKELYKNNNVNKQYYRNKLYIYYCLEFLKKKYKSEEIYLWDVMPFNIKNQYNFTDSNYGDIIDVKNKIIIQSKYYYNEKIDNETLSVFYNEISKFKKYGFKGILMCLNNSIIKEHEIEYMKDINIDIIRYDAINEFKTLETSNIKTYSRNMKNIKNTMSMIRKYVKENGKIIPPRHESYKGYGIGNFLYKVRTIENYVDENTINELNDLFETDIRKTTYYDKKIEGKVEFGLQKCREYYEDFKLLPITSETYKDFRIGGFVKCFKEGRFSEYNIELLNEIFHCDVKTETRKHQEEMLRFNKIIEEFKLYKKEFNKPPPYKYFQNGIDIGRFYHDIVNNIRFSEYKYLLDEIFYLCSN